MRKIILIILFLVVSTSIFADDGLFGFEYEVMFGPVFNDLFQLYEDEELKVEANLGTSSYLDIMTRFYIWNFFIGGELEWRVYNRFIDPFKQMYGASIGFVPIDWIVLEFGYRFRDSYTLSAPSHFFVSDHNIYFSISGKVGNVK